MAVNQPDPQRIRKTLWLANLTAVMLMAALILFLPRIIPLGEIPAARLPVLVLALLSLPVAFLARRLSGMDGSRAPQAGAMPRKQRQVNPQQALKANGRFAVAGTLAELPAMLGLVYALVGGDGFYALTFAAAALVATMLLRPE